MTGESIPRGETSRSRATLARAGAWLSSKADTFPLALGVLIMAGLALRLMLTLAYQPAVLTFADTAPYVSMADNGLFSDPVRPVGYSVVLRGIHSISTDVETVITLQHLAGLLTGVIVYAAVRRLGAPLWAGLAGAASVILSLDQIYLEHSIASEPTFTLLYALALYCGVRALEQPQALLGPVSSRHLWLVGLSVLLGVCATVRAVGAPLVPFVVLWAILAIPGSWRVRVLNAGLTALPAMAILFVYFSAHQSANGTFGIIQASGWATYSRTAPFADCTKFDPPAGTEALCETTPPENRNGPDFYSWQPESPAQQEFGYPPQSNEKLAAFGRAAILAQPLQYAEAVGIDFARYFAPAISDKPYGGVDYALLAIDRRDKPIEQDLLSASLNPYYDDEQMEVADATELMTGMQQLLRVHPIFLLAALLLAALGACRARGNLRWGIILLGGAGLAVMLLAVASSTYNARYVIPVEGPLVAAGVLGFWVLLDRRDRRLTDAPTTQAPAS